MSDRLAQAEQECREAKDDAKLQADGLHKLQAAVVVLAEEWDALSEVHGYKGPIHNGCCESCPANARCCWCKMEAAIAEAEQC